MKTLIANTTLALLIFACPVAFASVAQSAGQDMKQAGRAVRTASEDTGRAVKQASAKAGHEVKRGTRKVLHKSARTTKRRQR